VGGALGAVVILLILTALFYYFHRRRVRRARLFEDKLRMERLGPPALSPAPALGLGARPTLPLTSIPPPMGTPTPGSTNASNNTSSGGHGHTFDVLGSPYMAGRIPSGKHIATTRRELLLNAGVPALSSNTNEHGASTLVMAPSDTMIPGAPCYVCDMGAEARQDNMVEILMPREERRERFGHRGDRHLR
jgi:hypothetical protein